VLRSLLDKIEQLLQSKIPFVAYRKPSDETIYLMAQQDDALYYLNNYSQKGFVFAPFDDQGKTILFPLDKCKLSSYSYDTKEAFISQKEIKEKCLPDKQSKINHIELVTKGIDFLNKEKVKKVVLSRKEKVPIGQVLKSEIFNRLIHQYPLAFVSMYYHPKVGLWMGATPETLLKIEDKIFTTMSLAGTQRYNGKEQVDWDEKEKEEQQIVTDFIVSQLGDFKLGISKPFTITAGSLLHICTEIKGEINSNDQLGNLIYKLHPTPAVCGLPKEKAKLFIFQNENYDRSFYAGFLGELNIKKASDLYVNLRFMQIEGQTASLYIGGGITKESDPLSEWEETVSKSYIIKRILF